MDSLMRKWLKELYRSYIQHGISAIFSSMLLIHHFKKFKVYNGTKIVMRYIYLSGQRPCLWNTPFAYHITTPVASGSIILEISDSIHYLYSG